MKIQYGNESVNEIELKSTLTAIIFVGLKIHHTIKEGQAGHVDEGESIPLVNDPLNRELMTEASLLADTAIELTQG
jgi:hypothetical protein